MTHADTHHRERCRTARAFVAAAAATFALLIVAKANAQPIVQGPTPKEEVSKSQPRVRVMLADHTHGGPTLAVKVTGPYVLMEATTLEILSKGPWLGSAFGDGPLKALSNGIVVSVPDKGGKTKTMHVPRVRLMASKPGTIFVGQRAYRGVLDIIYNHDGTMTLVNELNLEDYVAGVVTSEMFYYWPSEALQAQAIVTRTYTLAILMEKHKETPKPEWDMEAGYLTNQEYQGVNSEHPLGIAATQATEGVVVVWKGLLFRTYFHSCCGGHTEACGLVWDDYKTIAPLAGTVCDYCKYCKWWDWTKSIKVADMESQLRRTGHDAGDIRELKFTDANADGHFDGVAVAGSRGAIEMKGNDFRLALHGAEATNLKSMRFAVKRVGDAYEFTGRGWGHGVGMCQWGAYGMAAILKNHEQIIKYYYPETELWKVY